MVAIGVLVVIQGLYAGLDGCIGKVAAIEQGLVLVTNVYCPKEGVRLDYIAGVPIRKAVVYVGNSNRSGNRN